MQQPSSSKFKCCLLRRSSISIIMILIIFLVISSSVSSYPSKSKFANSKPQKMMSAFANSLSANRSLQRQLRGQLAVPKGANANAHLVHRSHFLQMSTISSRSQSPSSSQSFALPAFALECRCHVAARGDVSVRGLFVIGPLGLFAPISNTLL